MRRLYKDCAGSVLMEYVIVCSFIGILVVELFYTQFFNFNEGFIRLGEKLKTATQQVLGGISLPIP